MPAYRSPAEAEVRDAVVAHLRAARPGGRIIHEINISTYGTVRMDLICVSEAEIIAVEIKSAKDKLDRLPKQIAAMKGCAHYAIAALHEKHLVEQEANQWVAHEHRDGKYYLRLEPDEARGADEVWVYPQRVRAIHPDARERMAKWQLPQSPFQVPLPAAALDLLWRDELYWLCGHLRVAANRNSTMLSMTTALRWLCNGGELTRGICAALRRRECVEADPVVEAAA